MLISNSSISFYSQIQSRDFDSAQVLPEITSSNSKLNLSQTDTVTISNNANELEGIQREIASRYDVTNLSENERLAMAHELLDNKLITPTQHAVMSFPIQEMVSHWPGYEGTFDPNKKTNYLQQSIDQLAFANSGNASTQEIQSREELISLLGNLNKFRNS